jgi:hypothetical protein
MIIGFGGRIGSGKTLLSTELVKRGFIKISFSDYLKQAIAKVYDFDISLLKTEQGKHEKLSPPLIWNQEIANKLFELSNIKNYPYPIEEIVFNTRRESLQYIGAQILRRYDNNFHVNKTIQSLDPNKNYVCDDVRYPNELQALKDNGAYTYFILRPNNFNVLNHDSETSINWDNFQYHIINDKPSDKIINEFLTSFEILNNSNISPDLNKVRKYPYYYDRSCFLTCSKEDAYYAGLLAALGKVKKERKKPLSYKIDISSTNFNLINGFKKFMKSNKPISIKKKNGNKKFTFTICSPYIIENLKYWNICPKTNFYKTIPDIIQQNPFMLKYWLLGLIDSMGSVYSSHKILDITILASKDILQYVMSAYPELFARATIQKNKGFYEIKLHNFEAAQLYEELYDPITLNKQWNNCSNFISYMLEN